MLDFAFWALISGGIWLTLEILMVRRWKPGKQIIIVSFCSGVINALYALFIESYSSAIGLWGYVSDYLVFGVPVTVPIYFIISGFGVGIFYYKSIEYLKKKRKYTSSFKVILPAVLIFTLSLIGTVGDIIVARPEFAWGPDNWSYAHTYLVWSSIWFVCLSSFHFFKDRLASPKSL